MQNCILFLAFLLFVAPVFAIDINVSVDRNPVVQNESFKLLFSAAESPDDDPDFSALNSILEVLNQRKNTQSSWVNGQSTKRITWTLDVMPKVSGELTIPPVTFGDDVTRPLTINVLEGSSTSRTPINDELFLEVEATPAEAYVQSQILYTVRLYQRVQISQASLTEPALGNAIVEKLGEDKQFNTQINGVNYSVFERSYAIFPQQSGQLTIPPMELTAQVLTGGARSRFGSVFNNQQTQTKRVSSNSVSIRVLPIPDAFTTSHWLVAENIHLQQTWSNDDLTVSVGEPLTRTLTLLGQGVSSSQLPDLVTEHSSTDIKMYPDQPMLRDQKKAEGVIALREQKVAIIPSKAGRYEIPAITIPWFNTKTHQMETATIPAVTIIAVASANSAAPDVLQQTTETVSTEEGLLPAKNTQYWKWAAIFLAIAWLATLIWIVVQRRNKKQQEEIKAGPQSQLVSLKELRKASLENNPQKAMQALLNWAEHQYGTRQLNGLSLYINDELQIEINRLNETLYANKKQDWDGSRLIQLVEENARSEVPDEESTAVLQPINKIN